MRRSRTASRSRRPPRTPRRRPTEINDQIGSFLTPALLALAGAAVLVGAFIIFNTFSITVAQRSKEFALLRALGTTRGQILAAVTGEAFLIGTLASVLGIGVGIGFSKLLNSLFDAVGFGIPRSDLVLAPRTVAIALGSGLASRSSHRWSQPCAPPAWTRSPQCPESRPGPRAAPAVSPPLLTVVSILLGGCSPPRACSGTGPASTKLGAIASGAVLIFVGVALSARYLVKPLASVIGWPIERLFKTTGPPGAGERRAQPGPHRHHLGGPDGRAGSGRIRGGLRLSAEHEHRPAGRRAGSRRPARLRRGLQAVLGPHH